MDRRKFIKLTGAGIAVAAGVTACDDEETMEGMDMDMPDPDMGPDPDMAPDPDMGPDPDMDPDEGVEPPTLLNLMDYQPDRVESSGGELNHTLNIEYGDFMIQGIPCHYRSYNGKFPADTLVVRPGDVMNVSVVNNLPPSEEDNYHPENINIPHGFNNINLHTHGMNVSPADDQDNILMVVHPGERFDHHIHVPEDHPAGLFWYHPHKHGSALHQMASGMGAYIVVEGGAGDLNDVPEIGAAQTVDLLFHELIINTTPLADGMPAVVGSEGPGPEAEGRNPIISLFKQEAFLQYTINGLAVNEGSDELGLGGTPPVLYMRPGEVQRWRFGLLTHLQTYRFTLEGHEMHVAAWDGITASALTTHDELVLGPANRVDLIIKASDTPGTYAFKMLTEQFGENPIFVTPSLFAPEQPVFNVIVEGEPMDMALPAALNTPSDRLPPITDDEVTRRQTVHFAVTGGVVFEGDEQNPVFVEDSRKYYINNLQFSPHRIGYTMLLDTAEEWEIFNEHEDHNPALTINHPFHIHVNWFQVMEIQHHDGSVETFDDEYGRWIDTVDVPFGGRSVIRHRFQNFPGIFVFHCHVIAHEDEGMMVLVEVIDGTPDVAEVSAADGGSLTSRDIGHRVRAEFGAGAFDSDTEVTYQITLDPAHDPDDGLVGLQRYFDLTSDTPLSGEATVMVTFPFDLPRGETYDMETVQLYRSTGDGWTTEGITTVEIGEGTIEDGPVTLPIGLITSTVTDLGNGSFALMATMLTGPVTEPGGFEGGGGHGEDHME